MSKIAAPISNDFCPQTLYLYGTYREDGTPNFGLFCWMSYYWDTELGVMACIEGKKLTRDMIQKNGVFSANLVTEELLPLADFLGNTEGYSGEKSGIALETEPGAVLQVPLLKASPVSFELEVTQSFQQGTSNIFLCRIRNVMAEEALMDSDTNIEERMRVIAPIHTTCSTYFSWNGHTIGAWGEPQNRFRTSMREQTGDSLAD